MNLFAPDSIQRAVSFDWETLVPIVFFVLYGLAQFLGSKKTSDAEKESSGSDADPTERAREIRDEILRKIRERNQPNDGPSQSSSMPRSEPRPAYDPSAPDGQQLRPYPEQAHPAPVPKPTPKPRAVVVKQADSLSSNLPVPDFEKRLLVQRERLAESRKRQQEAMAQTRRMQDQARAHKRKSLLKPVQSVQPLADVIPPGELRQQLFKGLRDPNTLRKAILYREILDPPLGLR